MTAVDLGFSLSGEQMSFPRTSRGRLDVPVLTGRSLSLSKGRTIMIRPAESAADHDHYRRLRRDVFVAEQGIFDRSDLDAFDDDPRTTVLLAVTEAGAIVGGVRISPATPGRDIGWWTGSRLVVAKSARSAAGVGPALIRAACAFAETNGVLRFDASVQIQNQPLFARLGWQTVGTAKVAGIEHAHMLWPIDRIQRQVDTYKAALATILQPLRQHGDLGGVDLGGSGFVGDDGAPVPGTDVIAACDAIIPSLVERDPEWAGWCAVLVNVNDLAAMGADPVGLLDAVAAHDSQAATKIMKGLRAGAEAWGVPILGGHTQLGVPAALSVTALGRTAQPVPGGGARHHDQLSVTVDLAGSWRDGYRGAQWDSSSHRTAAELQALTRMVRDAKPNAAKDISMAGLIGTAGMMAEASGLGAIIDVDSVPAPDAATLGDWMSCFPGFGMITADPAGQSRMPSMIGSLTQVASAECGRFDAAVTGVELEWPDGLRTSMINNTVTGLGPATQISTMQGERS